MKSSKLFLFLIVFNVCALGMNASAAQNQLNPDSILKAQLLFRRVTGVPITERDPRWEQMAEFIQRGQPEKAAAIATEDPNFYQVTLKNMSAVMSNKSETPFVPLDDFQATFIGAVRDELDARTLLTGNYIYRGVLQKQVVSPEPSLRDNKHFVQLDDNGLDYKFVLEKKEPQWDGLTDSAGLLTSRGWAAAHYSAGTNRRPVVFAFQEFLCSSIDNWKTPNLMATYVGRDVDRTPGKDPKVFQEQCKTCHAPMDGMRGAFAKMDFVNDSFIQLSNWVAPKFSRGVKTYSNGETIGWTTKDDSWWNLISDAQPMLGLKGTEGKGIRTFGEMLSQSEAFKSCMAQRVFTSICQRPPHAKDLPDLRAAANNFERNNFNMKKLFQEVASQPSCIGDDVIYDQTYPTLGIKNFLSLYHSMKVVTGVNPTKEMRDDYSKNIMTSLPQNGRVNEMSNQALFATKKLASLFCKPFAQNYTGRDKAAELMLQDLSHRFFSHDLSQIQMNVFKNLFSVLRPDKDRVFAACTTMLSSSEFIAQ